MAAYARGLVQFAHAAVCAGRQVEAFTFGTKLTRVTPALRSRDPNAALAALVAALGAWGGRPRSRSSG